MNFIKDNGGPIVLTIIAAGAIAGYIELRLPSDVEIDAKVADAFTVAGSVAPHRMDQAEEDIEEIEGDVDDFEDRWNSLIDALAATRVDRTP